ncbi:Putative elongator complex protein 1 [Malassezia vespertilionis]|uniref:Putative elongator complex protein 1 n=1 Tax=Malassezia vespertilionis TaxID=2020962 RepID=UPI0024B085AC|nr:Putative elongator complex protein 1 [Malassezia vespertilionis]WFD06264.1 Putative elongator complex protein 1 [Malassezia vespertilionis]
MRNVVSLAVEAFGSGAWHAVAPDTESRDNVYAARVVHGDTPSLVQLTFARLSTATQEEVASLAVVSAATRDELLDFTLISEGGEAAEHGPALCTVTAGGDIILLPLETMRADIVGSVEQGLLAAAWSPDEDVLVLITAPDAQGETRILLMSRELQVLHETVLLTDEFGDDQPVHLGWGSKTTQFHGSEGKQAAMAAATANIGRGPPVAEDDGLARISWRSDGAFFVVSSLDREMRRVLRIYTRTGALSATSDPSVRGISHVLACRPVGNAIATTQRMGVAPSGEEWQPGRNGRHDVVFFERNGLRHGEFSLREESGAAPQGVSAAPIAPWTYAHAVKALVWNADGAVLAVHLVRGDVHVVQLWTTGNYHWYLKQEYTFSSVAQVVWHREEPLWLYIVHASAITRRILAQETLVSQGAACVAVQDGNAVLLTPFQLQNVPPPMCAVSFVDDPAMGVPLHMGWNAQATHDTLAVLYPRGHVYLWRLAYGAMLVTERIAHIRVDEAAYQVAIAGDALAVLSAAALHLVNDGAQVCIPIQAGLHRLVPVHGMRGAFALHDADGQVTLYAQGAQPVSLTALGRFCASLYLFTLADKTVSIGLARDGHLIAATDETRILAKDASSFAVTNCLMVWTTHTHEARFQPLEALAHDAHTLELGRRIERGSRIVAAVPSNMALVLQMPRGNLETICPRPMVLDVVRARLDSGAYGEALRISRAHRVDLNILHDHAPDAFLAHVDELIAQVSNVDHINLLLSSMRNDDVTERLYRPLVAREATGFASEKVNRICDAFIAALPRAGERRYLSSLLTAYVRKDPPDYEGGLRVLVQYMTTDLALAEEACKYIIFLVNAEQLFRVALGMYDFALALLVAQHSQKDPREYVPFLRELRAKTPQAYQRFAIDDHLGRHAKALYALAGAGPSFAEEAMAYMVRHKLYREGLVAWAQDAPNLRRAYALFGAYLASHQRAAEAAPAFQLAHQPLDAMEAFKEAGMWQEALTIATTEHVPAPAVHALAHALVEQLEARESYKDAGRIALEYLHDTEQCVALLCRAHALVEAHRTCAAQHRMDLLETHVQPAAMDAQAAAMDEAGDMDAQLGKQVARLVELEAKKKSNPSSFYMDETLPGLENIDVMSDTMSQLTQFTRYTTAPSVQTQSTLSLATKQTGRSRAKQKREEKKKNAGRKGSIYEEGYLYDSVRKLLTSRLGTLQLDIARLLPVMTVFGGAYRTAAKALQDRVLALESNCAAASDTLFAQSTAQDAQRIEQEQALVAAVAHLAHQPSEEGAATQALTALFQWRASARAPLREKIEIAREKWKVYLLEDPHT